jgi:DNA-binding transcriptional LysR family regulator
MNLDTLKYYRQIIEKKSISKVANQSHISQSALSQMMQKFEDSIGHQLMERSNRGVAPTELGKIVYKYSENIMNTYSKMLEEIDNFTQKSSSVRISATKSLVTYSMPCVLFRIKKVHPDHQYDLVTSEMDRIIADVQNDISDFGVITSLPTKWIEGLEIVKIAEEKIVLVASETYSVPSKIELEDLFEYDLIMQSNSEHLYDELYRRIHEKGLDRELLKVLFKIDSIGAVKNALFNSYGVAMLPYPTVKRELYSKAYKEIQINDLDLHYNIYLIHKPLEHLSTTSRESIETFKKLGNKAFC